MSRIETELAELIAAGRLFHGRGWVPASAGNFSAKVDDRVIVTASGTHKGELTAADFVTVDEAGRSRNGRSASAEVLLHLQCYRRVASARAVLHTHSVAATVLSMVEDEIMLEGYEVQKALEGVDSHERRVCLPVFDNDQDIARLAARVDEAMEKGQARHGYLIRGHGLYAWGNGARQARYRVEALEFLLECELRRAALAAGRRTGG